MTELNLKNLKIVSQKYAPEKKVRKTANLCIFTSCCSVILLILQYIKHSALYTYLDICVYMFRVSVIFARKFKNFVNMNKLQQIDICKQEIFV